MGSSTQHGTVIILGTFMALAWAGSALAQSHVTAEDGSDALLPCIFEESIPAGEMITWERISANKSSKQILVFDKKATSFVSNVAWVGDLSRGDASVRVSPVSHVDAGEYSCAAFYNDLTKTITLTVTSKVVMPMPDPSTIVAGVALMVIVVGATYLLMSRRRKRIRRRKFSQLEPPASPDGRLLSQEGTESPRE
ncbi:myelin protein zero-like protein 2 [Lethenteron reissneri]|uniref:myelin protein zero-like protein 2 n=1 Tax=Lethenteron reissneri TaxID=7753 RepID=UPI002AB6F003|nr:myelin protein zero-like protein 2 [Lethenteron reissneri]